MSIRLSKKMSLFSRLMILVLMLNSIWLSLDLPKPRQPAYASTAMALLWDDGNGSVPTGWTYDSSYVSLMLRGNSTAGGTGGSDANHSHTITNATVDSANTGTTTRSNKGGTLVAPQSHTHNILTSSTGTAGSVPAYRGLMVMTYDAGTPTSLPANAIVLFDNAGAFSQAGFTRYSAQDGAFIRGAATAGGTGGSNALHGHSSVTFTTDISSTSQDAYAGAGATVAIRTHTHSLVSGTTDTDGDIRPPYVDVVLATVDSNDTPIPTGMIAMFNGAPTAAWSVLSNGGGPFNQKYMSGAATYTAALGSATHTHSKTGGYTTSIFGAATAVTVAAPAANAATSHSHTLLTPTFSTANNAPAYKDVIVAKKLAAYTPVAKNWRWYDAENVADPANTNGTDTTVGDSMANEDTQPTSTRIMYLANAVKLRIVVGETGGVAGTDVKYKLQFDTSSSFPSPVDVAAQGATGVAWRYYNGGNVNDDDAIANVRLSGSPSAGRYNEDGNAGVGEGSTFDPAASTDYEHEFTIQGIEVSANTVYYLRLRYMENSTVAGGSWGPVPLGSGRTVVSIRSAAVFDIETTAPTSVSFGDSNGSNTVIYDFTSGEKISFWDKRGTGATYNVTTVLPILIKAPDTIPGTDITWTSTVADPPDETKMLKGAFASDRTGMTTASPFTTDISHNAYIANPGTEGKGGFFFQPNITITNLSGKPPGNYTGNLVITIV